MVSLTSFTSIGTKVPSSESHLQCRVEVEVVWHQICVLERMDVDKVLQNDGSNDTWIIHFYKPFMDFNTLCHPNPTPCILLNNSHFLFCSRFQKKALSMSSMRRLGLEDYDRSSEISAGIRGSNTLYSH